MSCVIFGAGKIARGFIAHLLYLSNIDFVFVEKSEDLALLMNNRKKYTINVLGNSDKNIQIENIRCLNYKQSDAIIEEINNADTIFTAVGGKNLEQLGSVLARGIEIKINQNEKLNIVTCENWKQPAVILKNAIYMKLPNDLTVKADACIGITEAVIMRSAIESDENQRMIDPLCVNVQDFWELYVDASRVIGNLPKITGLKPIDEFEGFLERKFHTYNAANATVSYIGALLGYKTISLAARDERIQKILDGVYEETSMALCRKYGFLAEDQKNFALGSKNKLLDETIVDYIERNARDPIRKLGHDDRLIGPALMAVEFGGRPENLCLAIAAAIYYYKDNDQSSCELSKMVKNEGIDAVLEKICLIDKDSLLAHCIKCKAELLKIRGWLNE
jgi:mannitol-1-phosphate 5-dehydrogenase